MEKILTGMLAIAIFVLVLSIPALVVMLLWNAIGPHIGLPQISFWIALGVLALARILFGGSKSG